jgi:hypothetical protein
MGKITEVCWTLINNSARTEGGAMLTGSRRFLNRKCTDWDFVVAGGKGWEGFLRDHHFVPILMYADDPDTKSIWEAISPEGEVVQIVVSRNFEQRKRIIHWLDKRPELMAAYYQTRKSERSKIWKFLHKKAEAGEI